MTNNTAQRNWQGTPVPHWSLAHYKQCSFPTWDFWITRICYAVSACKECGCGEYQLCLPIMMQHSRWSPASKFWIIYITKLLIWCEMLWQIWSFDYYIHCKQKCTAIICSYLQLFMKTSVYLKLTVINFNINIKKYETTSLLSVAVLLSFRIYLKWIVYSNINLIAITVTPLKA